MICPQSGAPSGGARYGTGPDIQKAGKFNTKEHQPCEKSLLHFSLWP